MFLPVTLELLTGFWETLKIFFLTLLFSIPLGLVVCFGSMSGFKPLRWLTRGIIWVIRGTPLMLQLIVVFYGPGLMFGLSSMGRFTAVILAFTINYACYFSEIYRGGIESIPRGQYEAPGAGYDQEPNLLQGGTAAGGEADSAPHEQRGDHPGEGHLPRPDHRGV